MTSKVCKSQAFFKPARYTMIVAPRKAGMRGVVQHECDHLDGVLYPMRMTDMSQFGSMEVLFPELVGRDDD